MTLPSPPHKDILSALSVGKGATATAPHSEHFDHSASRTLAANSTHDLGEVLVITGEEPLLIVDTDEGFALTAVNEGKPRLRNACQILFRHAYQYVSFHVEVDSRTSDAHIGLLRHTTLAEIQAFTLHRPRPLRTQEGSRLRHTIDYRAPPLEEVQGIVWRGGNLKLSHLELAP
ncbi:hypothetical protein [Luteibacter yeojuensis]|uniref:Uncharacterized protein n=1 Tax=Luteibacter yeojuensis TaxID=345309 RepID=A0A7X5QXY2_9GAMM|nr:hypothetical protein [Luteibacter yeojuensis]NID17456.1 hypothetical protein [Luteibacter yeojuensis]